MLFIQNICISYKKDARYARYAQARRALKFLPVTFDGPVRGEVMLDRIWMSQTTEQKPHIRKTQETVGFFGTEAFLTEHAQATYFGDRIHVRKCGDGYEILYINPRHSDPLKTVFRLKNGQTGRIIYFDRHAEWDSPVWIYSMHTYTIVCTEKEHFQQKIFYVKEPDFTFSDMEALRYNGHAISVQST